MTVLQGLDHLSSSTLSPVLDNLKPPSTAVLSVKGDPAQQPYDDRHLSHEVVHAASLTRGMNISPTFPDEKPLASSSSHRRANTEVFSRPAPLPERQQSKTAEDLDYQYSSNAPIESPAKKRIGGSAKRLSDWFQGKSEPVNMDVGATPTLERRVSQELLSSANNGSAITPRSNKRMTPPSPLKQVTTPNRFSFFGLKRQDRMELPEPAEDQLLNLDVTAALFPPGSDNLKDQEAFDALRNNADTVIRNLQAAYKERTFALHEANADKNEKQEELEETRTRIGHLKVQLDGMAEKVQEQEKAIKAMAEEFEQEKQQRQQDEEARRHSVMLVRPPEEDVSSDSGTESTNVRRNSKRASTFTSDSGFESGDESVAESVFSRRDGVGSPTSSAALSPNISQVALSPPTSNTLQPNNRKESKPASTTASTTASTPTPAQPQRQSAYDRVMKGLASTTSSWRNGNTSKCNICHGVPSSEAWSVLGVLKEENKGLKTRLGELETVIDDCLGLVGP